MVRTYMHMLTFNSSYSTSSVIVCLQEKALQSDDYGKDLAGVEALQRKHKELEHDLTALEKKLEVSIAPF